MIDRSKGIFSIFPCSHHYTLALVFVALLAAWVWRADGEIHAAMVTQDVSIDGNITVTIDRYPSKGKLLLLWLLSEHGRHDSHTTIARELATAGVETWFADLIVANFLPEVRSSLDKIPGEQVAALVKKARAESGKQVVILASRRAAVAAIRGAILSPQPTALLLMAPNLYTVAPDPGTDPQYLPEIARLHMPVYILQPELSPWYWWLSQLKLEIERGGSPVWIEVLPKVRVRFHFRPDATPGELKMIERLPDKIGHALLTVQEGQYND